jgi:CRISPR/Cas system-associated protein Csm6
MADENEDELLPELDELIEEIGNHQTRLKRDLSGNTTVDATSELIETFLPLMQESFKAVSARLDALDGEVFPAARLSESDVLEILEVLQEARSTANPALAARVDTIIDALAAELGDEDDDEPDAAN